MSDTATRGIDFGRMDFHRMAAQVHGQLLPEHYAPGAGNTLHISPSIPVGEEILSLNLFHNPDQISTHAPPHGSSTQEGGEEAVAERVEHCSGGNLHSPPRQDDANQDGTSEQHQPVKTSRKKSEGLQSNKRYICYLCRVADNQEGAEKELLFTRRRSVRDHIAKIHKTDDWHPERAIEVIVDPNTGKPVNPYFWQDFVARTAPALSSNTSVPQAEPTMLDSRAASEETSSTPAPIPAKRRAAPSAVNKRGTASKIKPSAPPSTKRSKTNDSDRVEGTPTFRSPSSTPASSRATRTQVPKSSKKQDPASLAGSPAPSESRMSTSAVDDEDNDVDTPNTNNQSDDGVYCVCRRGDNHTWMIACDGGCDDWFHGKCVGIEERDGDLIDRYICPNCETETLQTLWKRLCRNKVCRKPARVNDTPPSKYCSHECGRKWVVAFAKRSDPDAIVSEDGMHILPPPKRKKLRLKKGKREPQHAKTQGDEEDDEYDDDEMSIDQQDPVKFKNYDRTGIQGMQTIEEDEYETDTSTSDEEPLPSLGGLLKYHEFTAIAALGSIAKFRRMREKPTAAPVDKNGNSKLEYDDWETSTLARNAATRVDLNHRETVLKAKEKLINMAKVRSIPILAAVREKNPKLKSLCGHDDRLSMSEDTFEHWIESTEGKQQLSKGVLDDPPPRVTPAPSSYPHNAMEDDSDCSSSDASDKDHKEHNQTIRGVCIRNRCARHAGGQWFKLQLGEVRFEQDLITKERARMAKEERELNERAILRAWEKEPNDF